MYIINVKEWLACKPEDTKKLLEKYRVKSDENPMDRFLNAYQSQQKLKTLDIPPREHHEEWIKHEHELNVCAKIIKDTKAINESCEAYPEYKNILETHIALL